MALCKAAVRRNDLKHDLKADRKGEPDLQCENIKEKVTTVLFPTVDKVI